MPTPTGPGQIKKVTRPDGFLLYNFDIAGDRLKSEHEWALYRDVVPALHHGAGIIVAGLASRSGSDRTNQALSERRASNTIAYLRRQVPAGFQVLKNIGYGEDIAEVANQADGSEDPLYRAVIVVVRPDITIDPGIIPGVPLPEVPLIDTMEKLIGFLGNASEIIGIFATGVLATALEVFGFAVTLLSAIIGLPLAWKSGERAARFSGRCEGFIDGIHDMAQAYRDPKYDFLPEAEWPLPMRPRPHLDYPDWNCPNLYSRMWQEAQIQGAEEAYTLILRMNAHPVRTKVKHRNGRIVEAHVSGYMMLRLLYIYAKRRHMGVDDVVLEELNRQLTKRGKAELPLVK